MDDGVANDSSGCGPLHGIRVIEFAGVGPGPHAAMVLADLGADVVRIQRPGVLPRAGFNADGTYMAVGAIEPQFYAELLTGLGLSDRANLPDRNDASQWETLREMFTHAFRTRTREEWTAVFDGTDACVTPVLTFAEAAADPHMRARRTVGVIDNVVQASVAPRFSRSLPPVPEGPARAATDPADLWND